MNGFLKQGKSIRWRWPLYAAALTFAVISIVEWIEGYDTAFFALIGIWLLVCVLCFCAVLMPIRDREYGLIMSILCIVPATLMASPAGLRFSTSTRSDVRWVFVGKRFKATVLQQTVPVDGLLRHAEWDGWGFPGAGNTTEYLVYDPLDSLPRRTSSPQHFTGLPCEVPSVKRMEPHWYVVLFYTDTAWNYCG